MKSDKLGASVVWAINWLSRAGGVLAAAAIAGMIVLICVEVILRKTLGISTMISDEVTGYLMVAASFLALGYAFHEDAHVRVQLLVQHFSRNVKRGLNIGWHLLGMVFAAVAFYHGFQMVLESHRLGATALTVLATPLYVPQALVPLGLLLMFVFLLVRLCLIVRGKTE